MSVDLYFKNRCPKMLFKTVYSQHRCLCLESCIKYSLNCFIVLYFVAWYCILWYCIIMFQGGSDQLSPIIVSRVARGTPADCCVPRLMEGDQVLFINGRDVSQHTHAQVVGQLDYNLI